MSDQPRQTDLPSLARLRAATSPEGVAPIRAGIVIGPGFILMDMVGVQTVFGLMPGASSYDLSDIRGVDGRDSPGHFVPGDGHYCVKNLHTEST